MIQSNRINQSIHPINQFILKFEQKKNIKDTYTHTHLHTYNIILTHTHYYYYYYRSSESIKRRKKKFTNKTTTKKYINYFDTSQLFQQQATHTLI